MRAAKHDRDLVGLERSLGLKSNRGISRQSNKGSEPIAAIVVGMKRLAKAEVQKTTSEIRQSESLRQGVTELFEEWAPTIWPDESQPQPEWLEDPDLYKFEGRYPRRLQYTDESDRQILHDLFYNLVVEKCCNYHSNQLQRARTTQRQSLDQVESAGETPQKTGPGFAAESDSEMPDTVPPKSMNAYHDNNYGAREAQTMNPGDFSFRMFQDYGMASSEAGSMSAVKTTEPAPPAPTGISWTPANMAPKEHTQEPTPSETATSDRPDRPMRPKRKRPQPNEEDLLPKKVSGDRKAKKPRWSQIIPLKVSPHHLARLANGERIASPIPTSPEEDTPPPQDDTIMSDGDDEQPAASNGGSLSSAPATPREEFATDSEIIAVKHDARSQTPANRPTPAPVESSEPQGAREIKSRAEKSPNELPFSNGASRPQSARPKSESAPASRPATSHRENEPPKPPPTSLTGRLQIEAELRQEPKWRPGLTGPPSRSPLPPVNGLHSPRATSAQHAMAQETSQNGTDPGRASQREADAVAGAPRPPQPTVVPSSNSPRLEWHHIQTFPGQQQRRNPQPTASITPSEPYLAHRSQISLVEEVLGSYIDCPTAREMLRKTPNLSRPQLEDMRHILAHSSDAQTNFDVFTAHVYGRDGPSGGSIATALASAMQPPNAPPIAPPANAVLPKFPPQHILPSNGSALSPRLDAPPLSKKHGRIEDVERILGDLVACPTVQQVLRARPNPLRRELRIMKDILQHHPESRTNLEFLYATLQARDASDSQSQRSPSQDHKPKPPVAEPPRGVALPSPRTTPGNGNPFNASDSNQHVPSQHQHTLAGAADPERAARLSVVRSPSTSEGSRRQDTPQHALDANAGRSPLPPGVAALRLAAPHTDIPKPQLLDELQPHYRHRPQPYTQPPPPLRNVHPQSARDAQPGPGNVNPLQHPPDVFGRIPSVPSQGLPQQPPAPHGQHQNPQLTAIPNPGGPGRAVIGQQDVFAVRSTPVQHEKEQPRLAMPIRSTSMQSEPEMQTPAPSAPSMSMNPTPAAAASQTNSLEDVSIEINWARNLDYADYLPMEACLHCKTTAEFFNLIEAQMPDELQGVNGNGNRIKEVKVKALTSLQGAGVMPRIKRDEGSGRVALKTLIKKLRSQPADAEIELEFLVVWE